MWRWVWDVVLNVSETKHKAAADVKTAGVGHRSGTVLSISRVQVLRKQLLILPQAAGLKIEKRSALQNTPQEFFTSVLSPAPAQGVSSELTGGLKDHPNTCPNTHWRATTHHIHAQKTNTQKQQQCNFFLFSTHIFQPPVGLLMPARGKRQKTEVWVCVCVQMTMKGQRVCLSEGLSVGQWKSWKVRAQSRLRPAPDSRTHWRTKAEGENKPVPQRSYCAQ